MKAINYISQKEYNILLTVTLLWIVIVSLCFCSEFIINYNASVAAQQKELAILAGAKPGPSFSIPTRSPVLSIHFTSFFILITLLLKRPTISLPTTVFYFLFLVRALIERFDHFANEEIAERTNFLSKIDLAANDLDILSFIFLPILLFWQISILLRMLIKNTQRKNVLP